MRQEPTIFRPLSSEVLSPIPRLVPNDCRNIRRTIDGFMVDRIAMIAVCIVEDYLDRVPRQGAVPAPEHPLRLALAYLYMIAGDDTGVGPKTREPFDELWREMMRGLDTERHFDGYVRSDDGHRLLSQDPPDGPSARDAGDRGCDRADAESRSQGTIRPPAARHLPPAA